MKKNLVLQRNFFIPNKKKKTAMVIALVMSAVTVFGAEAPLSFENSDFTEESYETIDFSVNDGSITPLDAVEPMNDAEEIQSSAEEDGISLPGGESDLVSDSESLPSVDLSDDVFEDFSEAPAIEFEDEIIDSYLEEDIFEEFEDIEIQELEMEEYESDFSDEEFLPEETGEDDFIETDADEENVTEMLPELGAPDAPDKTLLIYFDEDEVPYPAGQNTYLSSWVYTQQSNGNLSRHYVSNDPVYGTYDDLDFDMDGTWDVRYCRDSDKGYFLKLPTCSSLYFSASYSYAANPDYKNILFIIPFECGENGLPDCKWWYEKDKKRIHIEGSGTFAMCDTFHFNKIPLKSVVGDVTSVVIGEGITTIGRSAFSNFTSLTTVSFPSSLTTIGINAFLSCNSLTGITIPSTVHTIMDSAFYNCKELWNVNIPSSVTSFGTAPGWNPTYDGVFHGCKKLETIVLPESINTVPPKTFFDCTALKNVTLKGVTSIGSEAFRGCSNLEKLDLPGSLSSVPSDVFRGCHKLKEVNLGEGVTEIGQNAFDECYALESVLIPSTVTKIGRYAFNDCNSLTHMFLSSTKVKKLEPGVFKNCTSLESLYLPEDIEEVGSRALDGCSKLTDLNLKNVVTIDSSAVCGCTSLKRIDLSNKITSAHAESFSGNAAGKTVHFWGSTAEFNSIFTGTAKADLLNAAEIHYWVEETVITPATCEKEGEAATVCEDCGTVLNKHTVPPKGHVIVKDPLVPPTLTSEGKTEGSHCSVCGKIMTAQQSIPKLTGKQLVSELDAVLTAKADADDVKNAVFHELTASASSTGKTYIKLGWKKMEGADGYLVYGAKRNKKYALLKELDASQSAYKDSKLKQNTFYKYIVVAYAGKDAYREALSISTTVIAATRGGKYRNPTSVKLNRTSTLKLNVDKKQLLSGSVVSKLSAGKSLKTYRKLKFESSNPEVATVTAKGKIKTKKPGTCYIYVYSQNGKFKRLKIRVK